VGVVNNHMHRQKMMVSAERYGSIPRPEQYDREKGRDFVLWNMDLYYRYLNCGFRLPATAGTASGIMPSPIGYNRVYAKVAGEFSYDKWFAAVKAGRTFATNGPMTTFTVNGLEAGAEIRSDAAEGVAVAVDVRARSAAPLEKVEIVQDGKVVASVEGDGTECDLSLKESVRFTGSGWVAARCFEINPRAPKGPEHCAQTSPVYVMVGDDAIANRNDAEYFIKVMDELIAEATSTSDFETEAQRQEVLALHHRARKVYTDIADAEE
jgi:TolB protein